MATIYQFPVIENEKLSKFERFRDGYLDRFQPNDAAERDLVIQLAAAGWRLHRHCSVEAGLYDLALQTVRLYFEEAGRDFDSLPQSSQNAAAFRKMSDDYATMFQLREMENHLRDIYQRTLQDLLALRGGSSGPAKAPSKPRARVIPIDHAA